MVRPLQHHAVFAWLQTGLLGVNLVWTTACLGGFRAETMVVTVALTAALLGVHALQLLFVRSPVAEPNGGERQETPEARAKPSRFAIGAAFLPFLLYAAANVVWISPVKWLGWIDWFGWFQLLAVAWIAFDLVRSPGPRRALFGTLLVAALGSVLLAAHQRFVNPEWLMLGRLQAEQYLGRSSGPFGIPNSLAAFLLLLLPAAGALASRRAAGPAERVFFGWATLVLLFGLGLTISRGAWLGLGVALVAWPLLRPHRTLGWRLSRASWAALLVAGTAAVAYLGSERVRERADALWADAGERSRPILWRAGWRLVQENPWFGTGGGSFNSEFERLRPEGFLNEPMWAHNDYLNTLSDYGAVGLALLVGPMAWLTRHHGLVRRRRPGSQGAPSTREGPRAQIALSGGRIDALDDPWVRQGLRVGLLAFSLQLLVDFHFKIPALALAFATVAALAWRPLLDRRPSPLEDEAARREGEHRPSDGHQTPAGPANASRFPRIAAAAVLLAGTVALFAFCRPLYQAEAWRERGRERIDALVIKGTEHPRFRENVSAAVRDLERATALMPVNARAAADLAYAYAQLSLAAPARTAELGRLAEASADRAIAESPRVAEFWIRRGVARDMREDYAGAGDDFTRALALAPKNPLPWFHYAYHLSLRPVGHSLAAAMVGTCLRLDPKNPEALRLRQQLATARSSL